MRGEEQSSFPGFDEDLLERSAARRARARLDVESRRPRRPIIEYPHRHDNWLLPYEDQLIEANPMPPEEAQALLATLYFNCPFDWDELDPWMSRTKTPVDRIYEKPVDGPLCCPFCFQPMRWIYWQNNMPREALCGVGGYLEICDRCRWWGRMDTRWIS